jgi:ATP phosphoribosyltransferase
MAGTAGVVSASFANCHTATATQTDSASKLRSTLSSGSQKIGALPDHLLFAIPKKGRLHEKIVAMLKGSGFDYSRPERLDIAHCKDLPVSLVFLPAADIAAYVAEGNVDLGITGEDIIDESGAFVNVLMKLGFGKCRLSVQAPKGEVSDVRQLAGSRIVTSFPELAKKFFAKHESSKPTSVKVISGSVEAACGLGLADGIVDLVETGTTMRAAGLEEVAVLMNTQAVLISNPHTVYPELVETVRRRLAGYLTAQRFVMCTYNVHRSNLNEASRVTPGKRAPSVMNLDLTDWVSVSALVEKSKVASVMDKLESIGATDILTTGLLSSRIYD